MQFTPYSRLVDPCDALASIADDPGAAGQVVFRHHRPARPPISAQPATPLHPELLDRLAARGIERLYTHQATAIDLLRDGTNVALATGTASGKSLCYQAPILSSVLEGRRDTALLLFPTKALAHDQLSSLRNWLVPGLQAVAYDGDTPAGDRARLRRTANVVLTNPDMLHVGILPGHARWATFLMRLRYVVVDELHTLRGIFGTHVALVLRRLRRLCARYGSSPTFCFTSATLGNPAELASQLCGLPVERVDADGSPDGERCFALWQRPVVDEASGVRASSNVECGRLLGRLAELGCTTIAFTRSRKSAELVAGYARDEVRDRAPELRGRIAAYRAGLLPHERRELEGALRSGDLVGVAATNALELGIDIGGLDAVVLNGFPGTLASLWQQVGRAGRSGQRSAAILVAGDDQLDQWYADHPTELFDRPPEPAVVNPDNPFVLRSHVSCAAHELPLTPEDERWFGTGLDDTVRGLVLDDDLVARGGKMRWAGAASPAAGIGLRTGSAGDVTLVDDASGRVVGTVDSARAFEIAHPGALYLHQGRQYRIVDLDPTDGVAALVEDDADEYTQPRVEIRLDVREAEAVSIVGPARLGMEATLGSVTVTSTVHAFQRRSRSTGSVIDTVPLDLPPRVLETRACWYPIPDAVAARAQVEGARVLAAVHAAEHAMIGMLPLFTICDRWDVGGVSMAPHPDTGMATVFIYEGYPGGAGIAEMAHAVADEHLRATLDVIEACPCRTGCPSCVQSPKCGNWNELLDKEGARLLLQGLVGPARRAGSTRRPRPRRNEPRSGRTRP